MIKNKPNLLLDQSVPPSVTGNFLYDNMFNTSVYSEHKTQKLNANAI